MVALLGRPGPLQLLWDAARGGDLEQAVATVAVLTSAQLRLIEEYDQVQTARATRLAELSRMMEQARGEAEQLVERRRELESTRTRVESRLAQLAKEQRRTDTSLADLRQRAEALERLLGVIRGRQPFTGKDDIRRFRGALPWPEGGRVVRGFGRHYLPKYATYTVCNGLRLAVAPGAEVAALFPGRVAYASHFMGYGNMVVVDHGHSVYALAAGLATIHVRVGQGVTMGKRLGLAGPVAEEGNLYLEIRVGESPEDPRRWLQLEGAGGR
jgi:septal ring factor EnvC (AmiA/AmiB activator)